MDEINLEKYILEAKTIDLEQIGWDEYKTDDEIVEYVKKFVKENYNKEIDEEMSLIICDIIDNLVEKQREKP